MSRSERNGDILQGRAMKAWRVEWNELALVVVDDTAGGAIARMIELDVGPKEITSVREADVRVLPPVVAPALPAVFFVARETYSGRTLGVALTAPELAPLVHVDDREAYLERVGKPENARDTWRRVDYDHTADPKSDRRSYVRVEQVEPALVAVTTAALLAAPPAP